MTLRQRLILVSSLAILGVSAATGWIASSRVRQFSDERNRTQADSVAAGFRRDLQQQSSATEAAVNALAASQDLHNLAANLANGDAAARYFSVAQLLARDYHLDSLEILDSSGRILSAAPFPARFGEKDVLRPAAGKPASLLREPLPGGNAELGIVATRTVPGVGVALSVVGGRWLDGRFLQQIPVPPGVRLDVYRNFSPEFDARDFLVFPEAADRSRSLIDQVRLSGREMRGRSGASGAPAEVTAFPLRGEDGTILAVLLVTVSDEGIGAVQRGIWLFALAFALVGIGVATAGCIWAEAPMVRRSGEIQRAMDRAAAGEEVRIETAEPLGGVARSFNSMMVQLAEKQKRLAQAERVAAWRELSVHLVSALTRPVSVLRRLTGEAASGYLPSPRALADPGDRVRAGVLELEDIADRFRTLSRLPRPHFQPMDVRDALRRALKLCEPAFEKRHRELAVSISAEPLPVAADPELLHRAFSYLLLFTAEAGSGSGVLRIGAVRRAGTVRISIADLGSGFNPEEGAASVFAQRNGEQPFLILVQAVVSDHRGTIEWTKEEEAGWRCDVVLPLNDSAA